MKHESPPFKMVIENGRLVPATAYDQERLDTYRRGTKVNVVMVRDGGRSKERQWFAVLGLVVKQCNVPWKNKDQASEAVKLALGIVNLSKTVGGDFMAYPKSLVELTDPELDEAVRDMMDLIQKMTGIDPATLKKEAADVGEDEIEDPSGELPSPDGGSDGHPEPPSTQAVAAGSLSQDKRATPGQARRFYEEVVLNHEGDECLPWPFGCDKNGYGQVWVDEKTQYVHRLVCAAKHGPAPSGDMYAAHSCGNGHNGCCNRNHLSWKTPSGNQLDRVAHGTDCGGARNPAAKLTEQQVADIRENRDGLSAVELASQYGVARSTIHSILNGTSWVPGESGTTDGGLEAPADPDALPSVDLIALKRECIDKFLAAATDPSVPDAKDRQATVIFAKDAWKQTLPTELEFVRACTDTANKVVKSELKPDAARRYLEGLV